MAQTLEQPLVKKYIDRVARDNANTAKTYRYYLNKFNKYAESIGTDIEGIISQIKVNKLNVYDVLDDLVAFYLKEKMLPKTVRDTVKISKLFLEYADVDISLNKFRSKVRLPKVVKKKKQALDRNMVMRILADITDLRLKTYAHLLACTGMRATEALTVRMKDVDFTKDPAVAFIRGEYTKTREDRHVYLTRECAETMRKYIDYKYRERVYYDKTNNSRKVINYERNPTDLIFSASFNRKGNLEALYKTLQEMFAQVLDRIGIEREDHNRRRKITLHSFRRFAKSAVADSTSSDFSEWFIGHAGSTYYEKTERERIELFRKAEPALTFYTVMEPVEKRVIEELKQKNEQRTKEIESVKEELDVLHEDVALIKNLSFFGIEFKVLEKKDLPEEGQAQFPNHRNDQTIIVANVKEETRKKMRKMLPTLLKQAEEHGALLCMLCGRDLGDVKSYVEHFPKCYGMNEKPR